MSIEFETSEHGYFLIGIQMAYGEHEERGSFHVVSIGLFLCSINIYRWL